MMKIRYGRIIVLGIVTFLANVLLSSLLWMNPMVGDFYQSFHGHPGIKSMEFLGGVGNWIGMNYVFGVFYSILSMGVFVFLFRRFPGVGVIKGLIFGLCLWALKALPEAFNQWMLTPYPEPLILVQLGNSLGGLLFTFLLFGLLLDKFRAFSREVQHENAT